MKKLFSTLLCLLLVFSLSGPEAFAHTVQSSKKDADQKTVDYTEGVVNASELFYINGVVFWGYDKQLCSALIDDEGNLYDFVSEGSLSSEVSYVASDGKAIYMATEDGLIRLPLEEASQDRSYLSVLDEHDLSHGFQLYDDKLFFRYGSTLYSVPVSGGESSKLEKDIQNFQVTTQGIYCLNKDGDLLLLSLDGKERKTLCELDSECELGIFGSKAYITTGEDKDYIYVYDLEKNDYEKLRLKEDTSPYYPVWVDGDTLYYKSDEGEIYRYQLSTGKESLCEGNMSLPEYDEGFFLDGFVYYKLSERLFWMDIEGGQSVSLELDDVLASGSEYNIAQDIGVFSSQGLAGIQSACFTLYLPADRDWDYEVVSDNCVNVFYVPSKEAGVGGYLVSIMAYDTDDDSYTVFPHYTVAGLSSTMKYIAVFPTDVQYTPGTEKGYREMLDYVLQIDVNNKNNPFSCG